MAGTTFFGLVGANPTASVLDTLKNSSASLKSTLSDALNSALKSQLSDVVTKADLPVIAGLVGQMPPADIVAASSLTIQAFAEQQLDPMVVKDPAMQQAVDGELAKLSNTTTIGTLLQLDTSLAAHPLFKADVMKADIAGLLATSPIIGQNQQLQADFINRYAASTGTIQDFWNQLGNDPEFKAAVPELQFTLQLGALTLNSGALVAAIRKQYKPKSVRDLTALSANDWTQLITSNNISIPASVSGSTPAEKTANYVSAILKILTRAFPTDYIAQNLAVNPHDRFDREVAQFLKNAPQFNLITTNLQQYVARNPTALAVIPKEDQAQFLKRISGYQRLTRLNSDPQIVSTLASNGLDSAYKISSLPRSGFLSQYARLLGGSNKAQAVYDSAQAITASTTNFYMTVREGLSKSHPRVFGDVSKEVSDAIQQIPNWQALFGPTSTCACQECRSVLGAAAYFVDLLQFLSNAHIDPTNPASNTLLTILAGRRPDLVDIKLNCENTDTTLPYVDLVNEILESVVMTHVGDPPRPPAHDTPPDATSTQLSVNPEFTNDAAYLLLADAYYPFTLPFDRFLSIARTYLEFAGSSLYEVMKTFQIGLDPAVRGNSNPNPTPSDQAIALEYLKISANEFLILTAQPFQGALPFTGPLLSNHPELSKYYGYNPPQPPLDWVADLASVPNFLQRTGVTYDDLVSLLETHFLNPDQAITLQSNDPQNVCDVQNTVITNLVRRRVDNPDFSALQKIYRFIRLRSKLGWQISDLDDAIRALGATDIDAPFLRKLSQAKKLQDQLNFSVAQVLALWADIDTEGTGSLYVSLFQNQGALNPLDPSLALRYTYTLPATAPVLNLSPLDPYAATISYNAELQFNGALGADGQPQPMTINQERFLLSLSTDANYQQAVKELFTNQIPVQLGSLPPGFTLPTQLPDAIYYQGNQFFVVGRMSDELRTLLKTLPSPIANPLAAQLTADSNYQLAIDNLYSLRWAPGTEIAVATQPLASQAGQLVPAQTISSHLNSILAALRISATDLIAIISYLWNQSVPAVPVLTPSGAGGSLASGTYYVKVSVVDAFGERLYARETSVAITGPNGSIGVSWAPMTGAISYNVYYTTPDAGAGSESLKISPVPPTSVSANITTTAIGGSVFSGTAFPLNLTNLSAIHRYALLTRALSVSVPDLFSLIQLIGINPFQPSAPGTPGTVEFVAKALEVLQSRFSVAQLSYIYRNTAVPAAGLGPQQSDLDQFVSSLQAALAAPATEKSGATDPAGILLQHYLQAVLEPPDVSQVMSLIAGAVRYSAQLQKLPSIAFPASLQGLIAFNAGTLTITGPMSAAQENQLLALSNDPSYQAAIQNLFQQSQPAWATLYSSPSNPLPVVSFPAAYRGISSNPMPFSVGAMPVISSVSPPAAQGGASVIITGVNFGASGTVTLNGSPVAVSSWSSTQIGITLPAAATNGNIVVTVGSIASNAVPFSVGTMPVISSISPPAGQARASVIITGVNFGASGTVTLNGSPVAVSSWSSTQIGITLPAAATSGNIVVTVAGIASNAAPFSVGTMPVISSVSPPAGQAGASLTIAGVNFGASQGTGAVVLNGSPLTVSSWSDAQIVVTIPASATSGNIVVSVGALIAIDPTSSFIMFLGPMSADQESQLLGLSSDPNYQAAIRNLFQQSAPAWAATYTFGLAQLPPITLPNLTSAAIAFEGLNQILNLTGALSDADEATLLNLSTDASYQKAIESLYSESRQVLLGKLFFLDRNSLIAKLINDSSASLADKYGFVLNALLNSIGLIVQALSSTLQLDVATVRLLLVGGQASSTSSLLSSAVDPNLAAIADFFALLGNGLSGSYYLSPSFTGGLAGPVTTEPAVDFNWGSGSVPVPGLNPSAFSAKWTGQVVGQSSETYTFYAQLSPAPASGTVTIPTAGRNVTWASGTKFDPSWAGTTIYIDNTAYTIQSVPGPTSIVLAASAAAQSTPVQYCVSPIIQSGTVTVAGMNVTWVSGVKFDPSWNGAAIYIDGKAYTIQSVPGPTSIVLGSSAGAPANPVSYCVAPITLMVGGQIRPLSPAPSTTSGGASAGPKLSANVLLATADLVAGELTSLELDYPNATGLTLNGLQLSWSSVSTPKSVIPQHQLYADSSFTFDGPLTTFKLLTRIALFVNTFRITLDDLIYLSANAAAFAGVDPNNPARTAPFNLNALPAGPSSYSPAVFNQWERLLAFFTFRDFLPTGDSGLLTLFEAAGASPAPSGPALISAIAAATTWDVSELGVLLGSQSDALIFGSVGYGLTAGDFIDERWLVRLQSCFALSARFGVSSKQLFEWAALGANPSGTVTTVGAQVTWVSGANFSTAWTLATIYINGVPYSIQSVGTNTLTLSSSAGTQSTAVPFYVTGFTPPFEPMIARDIQAAVKAKYDDATWVKVGKSLNDKLREASRDALVAYILAPPAKWEFAVDSITTPDQLYEYFLIDVQMGSCMLTSRIIQATAAVQLFVQRCLMNLEDGISPSAIDTTIWSWMKNYRVWQANREVFLYPENWIDPTLRDDKTPIFNDLETELLQNPITPDNVQQAFLNYLEKLHQVARLDVRGMYWQNDSNSAPLPDGTPDATNDVLHVFARTPATPNLYFYRRLLNASQYGQTDGTNATATNAPQSGLNKSPSVWTPWEAVNVDIQGDQLLPVVWNGRLYIFWPVFTETSDTTKAPPASAAPPQKTLQIQMSWSEYSQGKWSPKQVSTVYLVPQFSPDGNSFSSTYTGTLIRNVFYFSPGFTQSGDLVIFVWTPQWSYEGRDGNNNPVQLTELYTPGEVLPYAPPNYPGDGEQIGAQFQGEFVLTGCAGQVTVGYADQSFQLVANSISVGMLNPDLTYDSNILLGISPPATLTVPADLLPLAVLNNVPPRYWLVPSATNRSSVPGFSVSGFAPFVYQDDWRSYFVTPQQVTIGSTTDANQAAPSYRRETLSADPRVLEMNPLLVLAQPASVLRAPLARQTKAVEGTPPEANAALGGTSASPGYVVTKLRFDPFWHPHLCAFEKTFNQYGLTSLLSLVGQQRTNDGGIVSGFTLSIPADEPHDPTALLTPGTLYAEGELEQMQPGSQPSVPSMDDRSNRAQYLFSDPSGNLYYVPNLTPNTPGDALIGRVDMDGSGTIVQVTPASALTQLTIFQEIYNPTFWVLQPYPQENVDFSFSGAYSIYNWEIFFHIPLLIATKLSQNQQFEEAQKWFHYIFDPTTNSADPVPQRFWKFLPFYECSASGEINGSIESLLRQLDPPSGTVNTTGLGVTWVSGAVFDSAWVGSTININGVAYTIQAVGGPTTLTLAGSGAGNQAAVQYYVPITIPPESSECGLDVESQVSQWKLNPFDPFLIARMRTIAFRKTVVMKYLDNLIAWGDYLFQQNTRESINEATQIYVLAGQILGDKPLIIPAQGTIQDYSYSDLAQQGIDPFSNALVTLESTFPFSTGTPISGAGGTGTGSFNTVGAQTFYFCVSPNDQLLGYWDTVADRLYKIRHCMNIQGQVEQLALFAPPINPALLVQAAAAGVDLGSVLNDINTPVPNYRFTFMFQKALELCAEVRSLGASLLSALEKNDAEGLSLLRSTQEISLLQAVLQIKQSQIDEANDNLAGLQGSYAVTLARQAYYQQLITTGQTSFENTQISELKQAQEFQGASQIVEIASSIVALIPVFNLGASGLASPVVTAQYGGANVSQALAAASRVLSAIAALHSYHANMASIMGGWDRRSTEWGFQLDTATKELAQIQSQIAAANVRVQIAQTDVQNQQLQITNAQAVLDFLNTKYTNQELYGWMISQVSATYFQCYQMAYGLAKRAEACLRFELGLTDSNFIQFGYWDSLRKGLLAGEGLYSDLKRMEISYLDQNQRKYEITKYVSLVMFDPLALIALKETGQCFVSLPEALFDMDYPGHYLRQIEALSITMPCVTGPYTSVNCKLTLVSSKIRVDPVATSPQDYVQDSHFITNFAATQSIVTSSAQNDSGMFELNFRDERYLPFQGAGAISQWLIELPQDCNAFDFETISDLVINLKYSARDGGDALRAVAKQAATLLGPTDQAGISTNGTSFPNQSNLVRFFSLRHEFPTEWYKFLNPLATDTVQTMLLVLGKDRFPFQYRGKKIGISQVDLLLKFKDIHNAQQFKTGTPQGDFVSGGGTPGLLNVYVTQTPQAPAQPPANAKPIALASVPVNFNGVPYGSSLVSLQLGTWWLQVFTTANYLGSVAPTLVDSNNHLIPGVIDDVFLVCHYSAV